MLCTVCYGYALNIILVNIVKKYNHWQGLLSFRLNVFCLVLIGKYNTFVICMQKNIQNSSICNNLDLLTYLLLRTQRTQASVF